MGCSCITLKDGCPRILSNTTHSHTAPQHHTLSITHTHSCTLKTYPGENVGSEQQNTNYFLNFQKPVALFLALRLFVSRKYPWIAHIFFFQLCYLALKGIVHPKMKICWKCTLRLSCRWVCFFILTDLENLLTNGSFAVNGCRQNESPKSW